VRNFYFDEGWGAYEEGIFLEENPYAHGSTQASEWSDGWFSAEDYYSSLDFDLDEEGD
jgi:hypothetical protein